MRWNTLAWKRHIQKLNASKRRYPRKHGFKSRLYNIWKAMRFRCYYPSHEAFNRYHRKGIKICKLWKNDYLAFRSWALVNGYAPYLTLDRIDNSKSYKPNNCRWATLKQQARNRINTLPPIEAFGEKKLLIEWVEDKRSTLTYRLLWRRIHELHWPPEKAITEPSRSISYRIKSS